MIIDVIKCEYDVMYIQCDSICVPNVATYTLVVMSLIEQCIDTDVCDISVMTQIQWL